MSVRFESFESADSGDSGKFTGDDNAGHEELQRPVVLRLPGATAYSLRMERDNIMHWIGLPDSYSEVR